MRRATTRGFTLIELILSLGLFSLLLVGLLQLLDTSTSLWKQVDARRDRTEVAGALGDRLAHDLSTLEAGPEGDLLVDWGPIDLDKNGTANLFVARLRFVRRAAPGEVALLKRRQAPEEAALAAELEALVAEGLDDPDLQLPQEWERLDRGLVETCWILASAGTPLTRGQEPVFDGVLLRGERFLGDEERLSFFDPRFLPAGSGHGRPTVGLTEELLRGVLWMDVSLATQTTVTDTDLEPVEGAALAPVRWKAGPGLGDGASSWDAWNLDRPDLSLTELNEPGAGMPDLDPARPGATPLLPRRVRVAFELQREGEPRASLRSSIDHTEGTFAVSDGLRLPEAGGHVLVGEEWMQVRSVSGDRVTVLRGQRGSQATPHAANAQVSYGWRFEREVPIGVFREDWNL